MALLDAQVMRKIMCLAGRKFLRVGKGGYGAFGLGSDVRAGCVVGADGGEVLTRSFSDISHVFPNGALSVLVFGYI